MLPERDRKAAVLDSWSLAIRNREAFLVNNRDSIVRFGELHAAFEEVWRPLGTTRDAAGRSHAGLLTLIPIFERQLIVAMNNLSTHQTQVAWLALRPAIEALLMVGMWAKDLANAQVWRKWGTDRKTFMKTFDGRTMKKKSVFPGAVGLSGLVSEINDRCAHPNPLYAAHGAKLAEEGAFVEISQAFFDDATTVEAHLLALLSVLEICLLASAMFVKSEIVISGSPAPPARSIPGLYADQAKGLRAKGFGDVLDDLGLWGWSP